MATFLSDILLDDTSDLMVQNGDWVVGLSDNQNIEQIIDSAPGGWFMSPLVGVGVNRFLNGNISVSQLETLVQQQLKRDGYEDIRFNVNQEELQTQLILNDNFVLNVEAYRP
ncbi:MAG: hypothetical protein JSS79_05245 [Bacteroidetes bacterium]|nr:hypothetical protein [Bacteroidota bacterium]